MNKIICGEVQNQLKFAEDSMVRIMNNLGKDNQSKEQNINKAYIILKDMQSSSNSGDLDIFYVKYKNLTKELENL